MYRRPQRGIRAELAAILGVDPYTHEYLPQDLAPPTEAVCNHLSDLIERCCTSMDDARIFYAHIPALFRRVFGYETALGWLETISPCGRRDRDALVALFLPEGPVHEFCQLQNLHPDLKFEFPKRNLPYATQQALDNKITSKSYLAPILRSCTKETSDLLILSPIQYFFICMLASPTTKFADSIPGATPPKPQKRSRSIPSTRTQYNQLMAAYAIKCKTLNNISNNIFLAACLDFLFVPWAIAIDRSDRRPRISTHTADAITTLLLTLPPQHPNDLDLDNFPQTDNLPDTDIILKSTPTTALYTWTAPMLQGVMMHTKSKTSQYAVVAYILLLSVFLAPWRVQVYNIAKSCLLPKPRPSTSSSRSTSMNAIRSTISSINAHLASPTGSPSNKSRAKESVWCTTLRKRQRLVDKDLFLMAVVNASRCKLPSVEPGPKTLFNLGDAARAARLEEVTAPTDEEEYTEELQICLQSLRQQREIFDPKAVRKDNDYVGILARGVGQRLESDGMLNGISEIVQNTGASYMFGMTPPKTQWRSRMHSSTKKRVYERRMAFASTAIAGDSPVSSSFTQEVPFLGSVWERPIDVGESEILVLLFYRAALLLEPYVGYVPNIRVLGRYWVWLTVLFCIGFIAIIRAFVALL